mmetsp:Transcript_22878/g.44628  ORF Transcript_22878/g.44628 Transcript_22878/m.44628 type:complete len:213 (+) Transcript_22878:106-744(+)
MLLRMNIVSMSDPPPLVLPKASFIAYSPATSDKKLFCLLHALRLRSRLGSVAFALLSPFDFGVLSLCVCPPSPFPSGASLFFNFTDAIAGPSRMPAACLNFCRIFPAWIFLIPHSTRSSNVASTRVDPSMPSRTHSSAHLCHAIPLPNSRTNEATCSSVQSSGFPFSSSSFAFLFLGCLGVVCWDVSWLSRAEISCASFNSACSIFFLCICG